MSVNLYFAVYKGNLYQMDDHLPNKDNVLTCKLLTVNPNKMSPDFTVKDNIGFIELPVSDKDITDIFAIKIKFTYKGQPYTNVNIMSFSFEPNWPALILVRERGNFDSNNDLRAKTIKIDDIESFDVVKAYTRRNGKRPEDDRVERYTGISPAEFTKMMSETYNVNLV